MFQVKGQLYERAGRCRHLTPVSNLSVQLKRMRRAKGQVRDQQRPGAEGFLGLGARRRKVNSILKGCVTVTRLDLDFRTIPLALVEGEIAAGTQTGEEWGWRTQQWGRSLSGAALLKGRWGLGARGRSLYRLWGCLP